MRRILPFLLLALPCGVAQAQEDGDSLRINILDKAVFYDGYNSNIFDADKDDGILRHKNSIYAVKLTDDVLDRIGERLDLDLTLGPLCDNYDRIGNVDIAFVEKGAESYDYESVKRIEVARYITPFMNKNSKKIQSVPFFYNAPDVSLILRDKALRENYDLWLEAELFGVPYAANEQIKGCEGRNDVFTLTVDFLTNASPASPVTTNVMVPIYAKKAEDHGNVNLNNYKEVATDTLGTTTKTYHFNIPQDVTDSQITLILTNHGAAENGEEYVRRLHLVYYDGELIHSYTPGGVSCEPYRKYNTQGNGIYGWGSKSDEWWEEWNNWCPGAAVPTRRIPLGPQKAGDHSIMIRVPDAVFYNQDGDFRPSLYFHGTTEGSMPAGMKTVSDDIADVTFLKDGNVVRYSTSERVAAVTVRSIDGTLLYGEESPRENTVSLAGYVPGAYIITVMTADHRVKSLKTVIND